MGETIDLRAHHVGVVLEELEHILCLEQQKEFPNSRDLQIYLEGSVRRHRSYREAYGNRVWDFIDGLARRVKKEADLIFRIVDSQDAICLGGCPFQRTCANGEYAPIYAALEAAGASLPSYHDGTVEDYDRAVAREHKFELGKLYSAKDLFPHWVL